MSLDYQVVKMYKERVYNCWQEEPIDDAEFTGYFIKVIDEEFVVKGKPSKKKVMYFKLGEWYEAFGSKEHPYIREIIGGE